MVDVFNLSKDHESLKFRVSSKFQILRQNVKTVTNSLGYKTANTKDDVQLHVLLLISCRSEEKKSN